MVDVGVTDGLLHLKNICTKLTVGIDDHKVKGKGKCKASGPCLGEYSASKEEHLIGIISEILGELSKGDGVSTFKFVGSGVVAALLNYFSCGYFSKEKISELNLPKLRQEGLRRFKAFLEVALPSGGNEGKVHVVLVFHTSMKPVSGDSSSEDEELDISLVEIDDAFVIEENEISDEDVSLP